MELILRSFLNFLKLAVVSAVLICICIVIDVKTGTGDLLSTAVLIITVAMGIVAYKRQCVVFKKGNPRQNIISVLFIIVGLLWIKFITEWGVVFCYLFTVNHYMG